MRKRIFGILLSFALMLTMMPVLNMSVYASEYPDVSWGKSIEINEDTNIGALTVTDNITVTISANKKLTVTKGINAENKTLTIAGEGSLIVTNVAGAAGAESANTAGGTGGAGGDAIKGTLVVEGATVQVTGGNGGKGGNSSSERSPSHSGGVGGNGGSGVLGNVTVKSGSFTAIGGNAGNGGNGNRGNGGSGGRGGNGVLGGVTLNGGVVAVTGGIGGNGGSTEMGQDAYGGAGGSGVQGSATVSGGSINATGGKGGQCSGSYGDGNGGSGIDANITVTGGSATLNGGEKGGDSAYVGLAVGNTITGKSQESDDNKNWSAVTGTSSKKRYVKVEPAHNHNFISYAAINDTITATCDNKDGNCPLPESSAGAGDRVATLTIAAPDSRTYDATAKAAKITDANSIQGDAKVQYQKKTDGSYGTSTENPPVDAGDYKATITVGGATASVEYTIAKADPTAVAPTATATFGQTLADVTLTNPSGNTDGTWAWADDTQSVGDVVTPAAKFKANFTPTDTANYNSKDNEDVEVTVSKAPAREPLNVFIDHAYTKTDFSLYIGNVMPENAGTLSYQVGTVTTRGNVDATDVAVDANHYLKATFTNVEINDTVTIPITISSTNYEDSQFQATIRLKDRPAEITTLPAAKNLTANGSAQELVTAGEAFGGTMQYALGENDEIAPTDGWGEAIPKGTNAGDYYVWYKAVGDAHHTDSATNVVKVTIAQKPADTTPVGSVHNVAGSNYIVTSAGTVSLLKATSKKSFTLPATVVIDGKTFSVTGIYAKAFKGTKERTLVVKTKGLTKKSVKGSLKGSKIKKVKVKVGKKKENKKYVKKYKKIFTKKNCGKKVRVRR